MRNCPERVSTKASVLPRFSSHDLWPFCPTNHLPFYLANCGPSVVLCARALIKQGSLRRNWSSISRTMALQSFRDLSHELWLFFLTAVATFRDLLFHQLWPFCPTNYCPSISRTVALQSFCVRDCQVRVHKWSKSCSKTIYLTNRYHFVLPTAHLLSHELWPFYLRTTNCGHSVVP